MSSKSIDKEFEPTVVVIPVSPEIVSVSPKETGSVEPESAAIEIVEFDNDELAIFVNVLSGPLIVLFVKVS